MADDTGHLIEDLKTQLNDEVNKLEGSGTSLPVQNTVSVQAMLEKSILQIRNIKVQLIPQVNLRDFLKQSILNIQQISVVITPTISISPLQTENAKVLETITLEPAAVSLPDVDITPLLDNVKMPAIDPSSPILENVFPPPPPIELNVSTLVKQNADTMNSIQLVPPSSSHHVGINELLTAATSSLSAIQLPTSGVNVSDLINQHTDIAKNIKLEPSSTTVDINPLVEAATTTLTQLLPPSPTSVVSTVNIDPLLIAATKTLTQLLPPSPTSVVPTVNIDPLLIAATKTLSQLLPPPTSVVQPSNLPLQLNTTYMLAGTKNNNAYTFTGIYPNKKMDTATFGTADKVVNSQITVKLDLDKKMTNGGYTPDHKAVSIEGIMLDFPKIELKPDTAKSDTTTKDSVLVDKEILDVPKINLVPIDTSKTDTTNTDVKLDDTILSVPKINLVPIDTSKTDTTNTDVQLDKLLDVPDINLVPIDASKSNPDTTKNGVKLDKLLDVPKIDVVSTNTSKTDTTASASQTGLSVTPDFVNELMTTLKGVDTTTYAHVYVFINTSKTDVNEHIINNIVFSNQIVNP